MFVYGLEANKEFSVLLFLVVYCSLFFILLLKLSK